MIHKISYGTENIEFTLDRRARKTLAIHVYPDKHVEVVAPDDAGLENILSKVQKRASWVLRKQKEFSRMQPQQPKPKYQTGETFRYLGKQYRLQVVDSDWLEVKLRNGRFLLMAPTSSDDTAKGKLLLDWFRKKGEIVFNERMQECVKATSVIGIKEFPPWQIKAMQKRWGSCTKEGKVYLNPELIAAPKPSIDYVILHELCHLLEHNHSTRFYNLLTKAYPDWKRWRDYLNENIEVRLV